VPNGCSRFREKILAKIAEELAVEREQAQERAGA
jgi:hypothetical protein